MTPTEALRQHGWEAHEVRELAQHVARTPEQARYLEQRAREVALRRARQQQPRR